MTNVSSLRPVRHGFITELVIREGAVEITALSAALGVSAATIRRDIEALERCGVVRRVHGGAVRAGSGTDGTDPEAGPPAPPAERRAATDRADLAALAAACGAAVGPGTTVAVSGGTAAVAVAPAVARARPGLVVTHDLAVVRAVRDASTGATSTPPGTDVDVCLAPGILTRRGTLVGPAAVRALVAHRPAIAFIGTAAIRGNDVVAADHWEAEICQALLACASDAVLLADAATFRGVGLVTFATLEDFSAVLTGQGPPPIATPRPPAPAGPAPRASAAAPGKDDPSCPSYRSRP